ncbi:MAG: SpaH/EbpB family LPXTG-anchored major pilin [Clostridia bacterium]|nr:SpaH/EbpB family LPXTG-anchored major pilin [Clostridia bacterium]
MNLLKKIGILIITILVLSMIFSVKLNAIDLTKTKGSLTIIKYEKGAVGHEGENTPLSGVKFAIYKVEDNTTDTTTPASTVSPTNQGTTENDGKVIFSNLDLGRYLVVEAEVPENVTERIQNFLVDIPQTTHNGTDLNYDVVVEPKNNTAYGSIVLTKEGENGEKLKNVQFVLQKRNGTNWSDYPNATDAVLGTTDNGTIRVENLPVGDYRFVETSLGEYNTYILDNKTGYEFNVALDTTDFTTKVTPSSITVKNDKPGIEKEVDSITRDVKDTNTVTDEKNSADIGDTITYKTQTDIPRTIAMLTTYKITDTMNNGLTFKQENFTVKAGNTTLTKDTDYTVTALEANHGFVLEINTAGKTKLNTEYNAGNKKMEVKYDTLLNSDADATSVGNKNTAKLTYSNTVNTNYKDETNTPVDKTTDEVDTTVYTGGLIIEKRENTRTGTLLPGAVFKIASTKANAENKVFIKDSNGQEITLTTGTNGSISYKGLSYGTYYLVETQAPSYQENNETKYYNLLDKPVQITVGNNTYTSNANIVINRKSSILPNTGAIGAIVAIIAGIGLIALAIIIHKKK